MFLAIGVVLLELLGRFHRATQPADPVVRERVECFFLCNGGVNKQTPSCANTKESPGWREGVPLKRKAGAAA